MPGKDHIWQRTRAALRSLQGEAGAEAIRAAQNDLRDLLHDPHPSFDDPDALEAWKGLVVLADVEAEQMSYEQRTSFAECIWRVYDDKSGLFK